MSTELTYFLVSGNFRDVENPDPNTTSNQTLFQIITGLVTFYPRVPLGFVAYITNLDLQTTPSSSADTALAIAPIQARILSGQLQCINIGDTRNIHLLSNTSIISSQLQAATGSSSLVWDVKFSNLVYAENSQFIAPFGFVAPIDTTPVSITDPNLTRLPYGGPWP